MVYRPWIPVEFSEAGLQVAAEYALDEEDRRRGLMFRPDVPFPYGGMLLAYPRPIPGLGVWMRHTPIPLSAAFLDGRRCVIQIVDLEPFSEEVVRASTPAQYVLETHQGTFRRVGVATREVRVGDVAAFTLPRNPT